MTVRNCAECGCEFDPSGSRGKTKLFCSQQHRWDFENRRASRGKALVGIAQAWRKTRGSGDYGKFLFMELSSLLDNWNADDAANGRIDPVEYSKSLTNYEAINPDYNGGRTFWADRWMDRLTENR